MISNIKLKFGSSPKKPPLETPIAPITVFVGPNNSGKSVVLKELHNFCFNGVINANTLIFDTLKFKKIENPEIEINKYTLEPQRNETILIDEIIFGKNSHRLRIKKSDILRVFSDIDSNLMTYCSSYVAINTIRIDGASRITLIAEQDAGDLLSHSTNSLQTLFKDNLKRKEVRRILFDAFKKYFVIDPTKLGKFRIRLSDTPPLNEAYEKTLESTSVDFYGKATDIRETSDGVKAFTGIIITIIAGDPKIILIDEPEAFLHPALASDLGKEVGKSIESNSKNLFVSTHSAHFLMGCIQSGTPLNIIRLTYSGNTPTARILPSDKVLKLMRHPLLRSTGVLNGLFYEYVIVTEADSDRAFYQEINERLLADKPARGISNCLFLNAQNKQTVHEIIKPLRELGIPCAAILDVDVIKDGGVTWTKLLESAFIPDVTIQATNISRSSINEKFKGKSATNFKTQGGVNVLDQNDKEACNNLFDQLDEYGIFTVRGGELESWLKQLGVGGHGPGWLIEIFEKMGEDPVATDYVKASTGDVWEFMSRINNWFSNPARKGNPE
jgi:predicted ATPase